MDCKAGINNSESKYEGIDLSWSKINNSNDKNIDFLLKFKLLFRTKFKFPIIKKKSKEAVLTVSGNL